MMINTLLQCADANYFKASDKSPQAYTENFRVRLF